MDRSILAVVDDEATRSPLPANFRHDYACDVIFEHHLSHATPARAFVRIAVAAAVVIWFVVPTRAATFTAGPVAAPAGLAPLAPFADMFTFESGADAAFESFPFLTSADVRRSAIFDMNGANFSVGPLLQTGSVQMHDILEGLPSHDDPLALGDSATILGPSLPIASSQAASIEIAATSPVSEPHASALLLTGAMLLAWNLYGRRMEKRNAGQ